MTPWTTDRESLVAEPLAKHDSRDTPWPGGHRHVNVWYEPEGGYIVGFNEGPRGWGFSVKKVPVVRIGQTNE